MSELGVISPYRSQVAALHQALRDDLLVNNSAGKGGDKSILCAGSGSNIDCGNNSSKNDNENSSSINSISVGNGNESCEISTVDKYQGRDMSAIILSTVRSNPEGMVGDLLRDWRRINVALTRAKQKLIVIGSLDIFNHVPVLREMSNFMQRNDYVVSIPPQGLDMY